MTTRILQRINDQSAMLAGQIHRSLVRVESGRWGGAGAGTIWHSDGLILTNAHVVRSRKLKVALPNGKRLPARIVATDRDLDLAALSVQSSGLPTIELGDSGLLRPGHWVFAFGHPWGVDGAATAGIVIGQGPSLPEHPSSGQNWLAVSLHYRPGHSGGPLVNAEGQLVGINTVMLGPDVGLAVPVDEVKRFLKQNMRRAA